MVRWELVEGEQVREMHDNCIWSAQQLHNLVLNWGRAQDE